MFSNLSAHTKTRVYLYLAILAFYAVFSYGLTAPNLMLINAGWFERWQWFMWRTFFNDRQLLTWTYIVFISLLATSYYLILRSLHQSSKKGTAPIKIKQQWLLIALLCLPLLLSYNALSYDVFNYIFNSRMILEYQTNPHLRTAIEFVYDPWTRFMHNVHTPAPYGYGWTVFSLIPYFLGFGKFLLTWINFRLLSVVSLLMISLIINQLHQQLFKKKLSLQKWALLFFNPLLILEVVSNFHNDLWMMAPAMVGIWLLLKAKDSQNNKHKIKQLSLGLLLWAVSISIKYATLALAPVFLWLTLLVLIPKKTKNLGRFLPQLGLYASFLMFLPLLTLRSQQFHPWYLTWSLVWLPLITHQLWQTFLLALSLSSLFRYFPWLLTNDYSSTILIQQKLITWVAPILVLIGHGINSMRTSNFLNQKTV